jgi:hypothetical protein
MPKALLVTIFLILNVFAAADANNGSAQHHIVGTVVDENDGVVPNVPVAIQGTDIDTNARVVTDADGHFVAVVAPGIYSVGLTSGESDSFLFAQTIASVGDADEAVAVTLMVHSTDDSITGAVINTPEIDLRTNFTLTAVGRNGDDVLFRGNAKISGDGRFVIRVSSLLGGYQLSAASSALPDGYYISPKEMDNVAAGSSDIVFTIKKSTLKAQVTVLNEANLPVGGVKLTVWKDWDHRLDVFVTDDNGVAMVPVAPGGWNIRLGENLLMGSEKYFEVFEYLDTTRVQFRVFTTDTTIRGAVSGDFADIRNLLQVSARIVNDTAVTRFTARAAIDADGAFTLHVSTKNPAYVVSIDEWDLPPDAYLVLPRQVDDEYVYGNLPGGESNLKFKIFTLAGSIAGTFVPGGPDSSVIPVLTVSDTSQGITLSASLSVGFNGFDIRVPNGIYTLTAEYPLDVNPALFKAAGIVIDNNTYSIDITPKGVGASLRPLIEPARVFTMTACPNPFQGVTTITILSPVKGRAELRIFDLRGRLVATPLSGAIDQGRVLVRVDRHAFTDGLPAANYIAKLEIIGANRYSQSMRLIAIR